MLEAAALELNPTGRHLRPRPDSAPERLQAVVRLQRHLPLRVAAVATATVAVVVVGVAVVIQASCAHAGSLNTMPYTRYVPGRVKQRVTTVNLQTAK